MIALHPNLADLNRVLAEEVLELLLLEPDRVVPDVDLVVSPEGETSKVKKEPKCLLISVVEL